MLLKLFTKISQHLIHFPVSYRDFNILGNESEDDHDGYDAAYGDGGIEALSQPEIPDEPSTFEAVTMVDNVYYEASNEI